MADVSGTPNLAQTSAAPVQAAFGDAGATADNQKQALLAAIAQAGAAGKAQYQTMQQATEADRQAALNAATQREAVVQNMPPALAQQLGVATAQPFNLGERLFQQGQQSQQGYMGDISAAGANYMGELKASLPVVQGDVQAKIAALQEAANQRSQTGALDLALKQLELQIGQTNLQKAQASEQSASAQDNVSKAIKAAGGIETMASSLQQQAQDYARQQADQNTTAGLSPRMAREEQIAGGSSGSDQLIQDFYTQNDKKNGWPQGTTQSIVEQGTTKSTSATLGNQEKQNTITKFNISQQQTKNGVSDPNYNTALGLTQQAFASPQATPQNVLAYLESKGISPDTAMTAINFYANSQAKAAGVQPGAY